MHNLITDASVSVLFFSELQMNKKIIERDLSRAPLNALSRFIVNGQTMLRVSFPVVSLPVTISSCPLPVLASRYFTLHMTVTPPPVGCW